MTCYVLSLLHPRGSYCSSCGLPGPALTPGRMKHPLATSHCLLYLFLRHIALPISVFHCSLVKKCYHCQTLFFLFLIHLTASVVYPPFILPWHHTKGPGHSCKHVFTTCSPFRCQSFVHTNRLNQECGWGYDWAQLWNYTVSELGWLYSSYSSPQHYSCSCCCAWSVWWVKPFPGSHFSQHWYSCQVSK